MATSRGVAFIENPLNNTVRRFKLGTQRGAPLLGTMSSSDEDERSYQPVAARNGPATPRTQAAAAGWPKDGVNLYTNELFTDGDVLGGAGPAHAQESEQAQTSPSGTARPQSSNRMAQQKQGFAARRTDRLNTNLYDGGGGGGQRNAQSPGATGLTPRNGPPGPGMFNDSPMRHGQDDSFASSRSESAQVASLASTFDPNLDDDDEEELEEQRQRNGSYGGGGGGGGGGPNNNGGGQANGGAAQNGSSMPATRSPLGNPQRPPPPPIEVDASDLPSFLMQPGPKHGPIQCYIVRDKGGAKMFPRYTLFLEDGKRFLLAARKRKKATTSSYLLSLDNSDLARESDAYFGKLRSNFVGTEFTIFNAGDKTGQGGPPADRDADGAVRHELGCVTYQYNVLGTRGPRKMTGVIPKLESGGQSCYRPRSEDDTLLDRIKNHRALGDLMVMRNKPPRWNEELNAYCLNFNGRVTEASVKNFQLITDDNQNHVILQFGKVARHAFTMDYQWPISALQAFAICLSSFDNKLACE